MSLGQRRLILHVGPPKTGTSAVQWALCHLENGTLLYPRSGRWADGAHHHLALAAAGFTHRGSVAIEPLDRLAAALKAEVEADGRSVLISTEALSAATLEPFLAAYRDALGDLPVEILCTLRNPVDWASSAYNQSVKDTTIREARHPDAYLAALHDASILHIVRSFRALNRPVGVVAYEPAGSFVTRFLAACGEGSAPPQIPVRNRSMTAIATLAILVANRLAPDETAEAAAAAFFETLRTRRLLPLWSAQRETAVLFSRAARAAFEAALLPLQVELDAAGAQGPSAAPLPRFVLGADQAARVRTVLRDAFGPAADGDAATILDEFARPEGD